MRSAYMVKNDPRFRVTVDHFKNIFGIARVVPWSFQSHVWTMTSGLKGLAEYKKKAVKR